MIGCFPEFIKHLHLNGYNLPSSHGGLFILGEISPDRLWLHTCALITKAKVTELKQIIFQ